MTKHEQYLNLFDKGGNLIFVIKINRVIDSRVSGEIVKDYRSPQMKSIFDQYEACVNDQLFALLDDLERQIESMGINLEPGQPPVTNLQIFDRNITFEQA
ncbi:MAG: hypothetical protein ACFB15_29830 [Cyclobacteriaceae bacterium]